MTKLPSAAGQDKNHEKAIKEGARRLHLNSDSMNNTYVVRAHSSNLNDTVDLAKNEHNTNHHIINNQTTSSIDHDNSGNIYLCTSDEHTDDDGDEIFEPLGYQSFLYDVNVEYSPGGNLSSSLSSRHCFKMKCLPYMVEHERNDLYSSSSFSIDSERNSTSDMNDCDIGDRRCPSGDCLELEDEQAGNLRSQRNTPIDVTRETCAFLGNSDYVPNSRFKSRRVILELVSAKLSQSNGYAIPPNSSISNLNPLPEDGTANVNQSSSTQTDTTSLRSYNSQTSSGISTEFRNNRKVGPTIPAPATPKSPSSSKKFVNYTLLIKTVPGLDKHPAVLERRFSDFLNLYQGLKSNESLSVIVERNVSFPKKVYMGNFSLEKIAERSIEFTRLLHLCMSEFDLLWSVPFISFLVDKELKEAHRLALFGDPDDVQALIETAYHIEEKLYIKLNSSSNLNQSLNSLDNSSNHLGQSDSPSSLSTLPSSPHTTSRNHTISVAQEDGSPKGQVDPQSSAETSESRDYQQPSRNNSVGHTSFVSSRVCTDKSILAPINQRILVTFCMLFITYCRTSNFVEMRQVARKFARLVASQEYIDSLIETRHYNSLRACLLFLMNMTQGNVVDNNLRVQLKRRLEDIDGAHADLADSLENRKFQSNGGESSGPTHAKYLETRNVNENASRGALRITKNDLTSLLRDRNFCSFQS